MRLIGTPGAVVKKTDAQKAFGKHADKVSSLSSDESEFTRMEEKVLETEAEVEISRDISGDGRNIDAELEAKSQELRVDDELEKLKKKMKKR